MLQRWSEHVFAANRSESGWSHFLRAIRKYGPEAFLHETLETCGSLKAANDAEIRWIEHYRTREPEFGFNIAKGGGYHYPWDNPDYRARQIAFKTGPRVITPESHARRSAGQKARPRPAKDTCAKLSAASKTQWRDPDRRPREKLTSQHRGVDRVKNPRKKSLWRARSGSVNLGAFPTEESAAAAVVEYETTGGRAQSRHGGRRISIDPLAAAILSEARKAAGLSLREMGARLGTNLQAVHAHESGKIAIGTDYFARALQACWPDQSFAA
jgi:hypothetical protein